VKKIIQRKPSKLNNGLARERKDKRVWREEMRKNIAYKRSKKQEDYTRCIESAYSMKWKIEEGAGTKEKVSL
jgi:hypothetical protein